MAALVCKENLLQVLQILVESLETSVLPLVKVDDRNCPLCDCIQFDFDPYEFAGDLKSIRLLNSYVYRLQLHSESVQHLIEFFNYKFKSIL